MKRVLILTIILPFMVITTQAQFQKVQKNNPPLQKTGPKLTGTILQPVPGSNTNPVKVINVGGGRTITVALKRNPNTGSEPAFNKENKANLPEEKSTGTT
jgi:hypothetical protein